jgi:hypothetical protein
MFIYKCTYPPSQHALRGRGQGQGLTGLRPQEHLERQGLGRLEGPRPCPTP